MRRHKAQALVEFAVSVSVFMLLVLGTFDLARAYMAYTVVSNAAREASRYGAAHIGESGWTAAALQAGSTMAVGLDASALNLNVTTQQLDALTYITVSGTYRFHSVIPFVGALMGDPITIQVNTSAPVG